MAILFCFLGIITFLYGYQACFADLPMEGLQIHCVVKLVLLAWNIHSSKQFHAVVAAYGTDMDVNIPNNF